MNTINKNEIEKFSKMAEEWWDIEGKFKPLHKFNPIRIKYIKDSIIENFKYEEKINLEYLEKICSAYSEFFFSYSESPLLVLNVDDVDFVSNQMDFNQIIDCVKKNIIGREFINLSPSFF